MIALTLPEWGIVASFLAAAGVVIQIIVHACGVRGRRKDSQRIENIQKNTDNLLRLEQERDRAELERQQIKVELDVCLVEVPSTTYGNKAQFFRLDVRNVGHRKITLEALGFRAPDGDANFAPPSLCVNAPTGAPVRISGYELDADSSVQFFQQAFGKSTVAHAGDFEHLFLQLRNRRETLVSKLPPDVLVRLRQ